MQTDFSKSNSFHSSASTDRYRGMIEKTFYKKTRDNLFQLFGYIYSVSSNFFGVHTFISIWRIWQIALPALVPVYPVWKEGTFAKQFVDVLSTLAYFIPSSSYEKATVPFLLVYSILFIGFVSFLDILSFYFANKATMAPSLPSIIVFFCSTFGYILHAPAINLVGQYIGRLCVGDVDEELPFAIFLVLFTTLSYTLYITMLKNIISVSATFRPDSLMCVNVTTSTNLVGVPTIGILLLAIGSQLPFIGRIVMASLTVLIYIYLLVSMLFSGCINMNHSAAITSAAFSGSIMIILVIVEDSIGMEAFSLQSIVYVIIWIVSFYLFKFYFQYKKNVNIIVLDEITEDESFFDCIKNVKQFTNIAYDGFSIGHPICLNWSFCQLAISRWPEKIDAWYVYLKFVAIYPEETRILSSIGHSILKNNITGSLAKHSIEQISALLRQRESNLSVALKQKLMTIAKLVQSSKHKLRYVWDMAIQGNTAEMENAILRTYDSVQKCDSQYKRLLLQYPNNRFLTRSYSRFLIEVCADVRNFEKYDNQTKILQRGLLATEDQAHSLGLHMFPVLPNRIHDIGNSQSINGTIDDNISIGSTIDGDSSINEHAATIAQNVEDMVFPAFSALCPTRFIMAILFFIVPIAVFCAYAFIQVSTIRRPLDYIYALSNEEMLLYIIPAFSQRFVLEKSNILPERNQTGIGGYKTTPEQLSFIINASERITQMIKVFQDNDLNVDYLNEARQKLFRDKINYTKYVDGNPELTQTTASTILIEFVITASSLLTNPSIQPGMDQIRELIDNKDNAVNQVMQAIDCVQNYIDYRKIRVENLVLYISIGIDVVVGLIWIITIAIMVHYIRREKEEVYLCLTSLQKNVVSAISDRLRLIKKADQASSTQNSDTDLNKQEENILKIFTTANDDNYVISVFNLANMGSTIIQFVIYLIMSYLVSLMIGSQLSISVDQSPQFSTTFESYAFQIAILSNILTLKENNPATNESYIFDVIQLQSDKVSRCFYSMQFGFEGKKPSQIFIDNVYKASDGEVSSALQYLLTNTYVNQIITLFDKDAGTDAVSTNKIEQIWGMTNDYLYPNFYQEIFATILDNAKDMLQPNRKPYFAIIVALGLILIIAEISIIFYNAKEQKILRFTLGLLQHCPPHIIQQSTRIMSVLSGNFSNKRLDKTLRGTDYFLEIIQNVPDGIIIINRDEVTLMNKTACRIFNTTSYQGKRIDSIIGSNNEEFLKQFNAIQEATAPVPTIYVADDSTTYNIDISLLVMKDDRIYIMRDTTQYKRYNTLIAEERMKSDMLLSSILPPKLVARVQAGEKDISFEVQSASVLFMDIVEFTPWCASLNAADVMKTLNRLFTEFDKLVSKTQTITRIKCIGDCYMAAGGILSDVNIPDLHAKEAVQFGLDSIDAVTRVNEEINQNLRIRVGVNTGGPLVAGVIGIGKPTFEIIGPVINMAQQMEHNGVPMNVHISRAVYELIYGGTFNIKERGQIEIKGGTAVTYLVTK